MNHNMGAVTDIRRTPKDFFHCWVMVDRNHVDNVSFLAEMTKAQLEKAAYLWAKDHDISERGVEIVKANTKYDYKQEATSKRIAEEKGRAIDESDCISRFMSLAAESPFERGELLSQQRDAGLVKTRKAIAIKLRGYGHSLPTIGRVMDRSPSALWYLINRRQL